MPSSMDPETEKHLASMLIDEATTLRQRADREGVHIYLHQPGQRNRPNSRFLTATVLGVQQANRVAEVNEMWRIREKELQLNGRSRKSETRSSHQRSSDYNRQKRHSDYCSSPSMTKADRKRLDNIGNDPCISNSQEVSDGGCSLGEDGALREEELEDFLLSRAKRGRGSVGSRMDEPGPYLPSSAPGHRNLGPDKPTWLKRHQDKDDSDLYEPKKKAAKEPDHAGKLKVKKKRRIKRSNRH